MTILNEEQTKKILDGAIEQIREAVIDEATRDAAYKVKYAVGEEVHNIVSKFIREEVGPEIVTSLSEKKSAIIQAAITSAENMAVMLAESMTTKLAENLGSTWKRSEIFKKLFE